jgi:hypothetical protein
MANPGKSVRSYLKNKTKRTGYVVQVVEVLLEGLSSIFSITKTTTNSNAPIFPFYFPSAFGLLNLDQISTQLYTLEDYPH